MLKRLAANPVFQAIAAFLIGAYIRFVGATSSWRLDIHEASEDSLFTSKEGAIVLFWHGRIAMMARLRKETEKQVFMLISTHRDGDIIARAMSSFGVTCIRGSAANPRKPTQDNRGTAAGTEMMEAIKGGDLVAVTPDGPRGPAERVNMGVIRLAQLSGAPIIPATFATSRGKVLRSWDRFLLPGPFSKCVYLVGAPIRVGAAQTNDALAAARGEVAQAITDLTHRADILAGRVNDDVPSASARPVS
ncbi:MAG: lysophospholipid acyltransferase family protein [Pseudomonadota bacterium]